MKNQKHTAQRGAFARAALLGGAALSIGMTAQAPTTYAQGIEVITVTAQRREQNLQDVGIAINAYSQQDLIQLGIENSTEIALFTPGVFVSASGAGQNSQFTIRGVTQNDFNAALEGPIAAYFDESYIPTLQGQIFATFDVNRVEILKGPQGTLFGRNATGGLVHYIPNKPTEEFEGYVQAGYGRFNRFEIEGAVGGGITEGLSARVSVLYNQRDGFLENIYPAGVTSPLAAGTPPRGADFNDLGNEENFGIRGQLQFEPNERFTARLTASYSEQTGSTNPYNVRPSQPVFNDAGQQIDTVYLPRDQPILTTLAFVLGLGDGEFLPPGFDGFIAPDPESLQTSTDAAIDDAFNNEVLDFSLHLNYEFDGFDLVSITDYKELNSALLTDVEASPINFVNFRSLGETKMFTQELRASGQTDRLSWTAGLYFLDIKADVTNGFLAPANSLFLPFAGFADFFEPGLDLLNNFEFDTTSYSLFGQVEYQISDQWTVLLGGRIIYEEQDYFLAQGGFANVDDFEADTATLLFPAPSTLEDLVNAPNFSPFEDNRDNTLWVGKVQIEYRPNDDTLLFAGISRGAKGGAYNAPLLDGSPPLAAEQIGYDPESLLSYEAGLKSTLLDGLLQVNASIFYYDYNDYQAFTFVNVSGIVSNQDARTYGGEIDIIANPYEGLFIGIGYGYFDNKVKDLPVAPAVFDPEDGSLVAPAVLRDVESTFSPQSQFSARVNYDLPFDAAGGVINLGAVVSTNSSYFHNLRNFSAHEIDGFTIANLRATWTNEEAGITLAAFVNNVFDKRYVNVGFDLSGLCDCTEESYGAPRQWGLEARFNF